MRTCARTSTTRISKSCLMCCSPCAGLHCAPAMLLVTWIPRMIIWKNIIPFKSDCLGTCWVSMQGKVSVTKWRGCFDRECAQSKIHRASSDMSSGSSCDASLLLPFPPLKPCVESCSTCQDGDVFQTSHDLNNKNNSLIFTGHAMLGMKNYCHSLWTHLFSYVFLQKCHAKSTAKCTCAMQKRSHCDAFLPLPFPPL